MRVGVPTEIKNNEARVSATEATVAELVKNGHEVRVEMGAGLGSGITDEAYESAGAILTENADEVWGESDMVLKVKEPIQSEYGYLRDDLTLFTYLHLAADRPLTDALLAAGTTAIAYETVQLDNGALPLLAPMSEVAGKLSVQVGAYHLMKPAGGRGSLLGGVPGTHRGKVVVVGGGVAGENAAEIAVGMGADVTVLDVAIPRLRQLDARFAGRVTTRYSATHTIAAEVASADLVIGSVLIPGARAPKLVTKDMVAEMKPGSVLVDIAIDQGGCFEGSHATTHDDPTFRVHDAIYYCVANMPGSVPETSTEALTNSTMRYAVSLANKGWRDALSADTALAKGLNTHAGRLMNKPVASAFDLPCDSVTEVLHASH